MKYAESMHTAADGKSIFVRSWLPSGSPKAVLLVAHGMAEHGARYERFAGLMVAAGWAVVVPDHRGHGKTAQAGELGWLGEKGGFFKVRDDLHELALELRESYKSAPLFLLGHSMGSVLAESYIAAYGDGLSGCVLSGVVAPMPPMLLASGKLIAASGCLFKGQKKGAAMLDKMGFASYNKDFEPVRTKFDWLSRDRAEVDKYVADPLCGFVCSFGFYRDFFAGISSLYGGAGGLASVPATLPVLIVAGAEDPVGGASGFVSRLSAKLKSSGVQSVETRLYPGARHELLNETNRDEVMKDLRDWLEGRLARP